MQRQGFILSRDRIAPIGSKRREAIDGAVAELTCAASLPGPEDEPMPIGDRLVWQRKVRGRNLWLWYDVASDGRVEIVALTSAE